jgi:DNA polymerase-3 subunit beta
MKFTIETKTLDAALRIAGSATMGAKISLPILGNIKIEAKGQGITLSTTNLDIYVTQKLPAKVKKEGATTAPFSLLSQLVGRMQAATISIEQQKGVIEFKSGEVVAELETLPAEEFPPPLEKHGEAVECEAEDILKPFRMVSHAICVDSSRYALMGININGGDFSATDARRFAVYAGTKISNENVIISDLFVKALLKIEPEGMVKVFVAGGSITLVSEEIEICGKLIEATFPAGPKDILNRFDAKNAFSCGRKSLINALQTCSIFSAVNNPGLTLAGSGKEIEVSCPGKAMERVLGTELSGQPKLSIKINENFLLDVLGVLQDDNVRIRLSDEVSPVLIEEGKFKAVIMPMRTA